MDTFTPKLEILPAAQQELWPQLRPIQHLGYVLYGGTALALRLGHRPSVDFDFFSAQPVNRQALRQSLPFLQNTTVRQDSPNTLEVATSSGVKVSFFGGSDFGRTGQPQRTADGVLYAASLADLMATKLKVILQRAEAKDYQDIAAMVRAGVRVDVGLAAAEKMFSPAFAPRRIPQGDGLFSRWRFGTTLRRRPGDAAGGSTAGKIPAVCYRRAGSGYR